MYKIKNNIFCIHIIITDDHEEIIHIITEEDYNDTRRSKKPNDS